MLPPSLEQLLLELDGLEDDIFEDEIWPYLTGDTHELLNCLEDLALRKSENLPRLRKVICGDGLDVHRYVWPWAIDGTDRGIQVKAAFAEHDIEFSTWHSYHEPRVFSG